MAANRPAAEGAIIVPVELPVPVRRLRDRMDPAAAQGVPAHVTLLYPFAPPERLDAAQRRELERVIAAQPAFAFVLAKVGRWPEVVYLVPEPDEPFHRLTESLATAFPEYPPYGGAHEQLVPHVSIAQDPRPEYLDAAEHALPAMLPVRAVAREALLMGHVAGRPWQTHLHLTFAGSAAR